MKLLVFSCLLVFSLTVAKAETLEIYTYDWEPYINPKGSPKGDAAEMFDVLGKFGSFNIDWQYVPYSDAQTLLELEKAALSFPYFYSEQRAKKFIYSKPLYFASVSVFYNRQNTSSEKVLSLFPSLIKGKVSGNSYGGNIDVKFDDAEVFETELEAISALLSGEISVLPMAKGVMKTLLKKYFSAQQALIKAIESSDFNNQLGMHVIASKNEIGNQLIKKVNAAIELRTQLQGEYKTKVKDTTLSVDTAILKPSEGYPTILGRLSQIESRECGSKGAGDVFFTLPISTKVIVLKWSEHVTKPSYTDRIYGNMMEESAVLVLNGPHLGKELCVKNMHVELL